MNIRAAQPIDPGPRPQPKQRSRAQLEYSARVRANAAARRQRVIDAVSQEPGATNERIAAMLGERLERVSEALKHAEYWGIIRRAWTRDAPDARPRMRNYPSGAP